MDFNIGDEVLLNMKNQHPKDNMNWGFEEEGLLPNEFQIIKRLEGLRSKRFRVDEGIGTYWHRPNTFALVEK